MFNFNRILNKKEIGAQGEKKAAKYLKRKGYTIVAQNVHTHYGEIDIIAKDGDVYVFVEVKQRKGPEYGRGAEAVNLPKQKKIIASAAIYCQQNSVRALCRFDVVSIDEDVINHIENAFQA